MNSMIMGNYCVVYQTGPMGDSCSFCLNDCRNFFVNLLARHGGKCCDCTLAKKKSASCVNKKTLDLRHFFQLLNVLNGNFCIDIVICYLFFIIEIV